MHKRTLSRADLVHDMGREIGFSKSEAKSLINAVLNEIASALSQGESAKVTNSGSFQVLDRKAKRGRNPGTEFPARMTL